jgi:UDP-N-acetylmuramoylalanine--D-glutamate ligase
MPLVAKTIAVLGLGAEGRDVLWWLKKNARDCRIKVFDKIKTADLTGFDLIFRSPGFWRLSPMLAAAAKAGAQITSATKLFFELCPAKIIGVTGTKGKGTTTTLIYQMLKQQGKRAFLAGNIGKPMLKLLPKLQPGDWVCLELSSFQLQDLDHSPPLAVVLNISGDHLDIHRSIREYRAAKANLVRYQRPEDHAVLNADYLSTRKLAGLTRATVHWFSGRTVTIDRARVKLRGSHNLENLAAAMTAAALAGVSRSNQEKIIYSFAGLEHRLELVKTAAGVDYINDSASTTPATASAAIKSFTGPITLILGGSDKGADFRDLGREIRKNRQVTNLILIGKTAAKIRRAIGRFSGKIIVGLKNMEAIVRSAQAVARPGGVVLLSPACASFDMFKNYQDRGKQFKLWVKKL